MYFFLNNFILLNNVSKYYCTSYYKCSLAFLQELLSLEECLIDCLQSHTHMVKELNVGVEWGPLCNN